MKRIFVMGTLMAAMLFGGQSAMAQDVNTLNAKELQQAAKAQKEREKAVKAAAKTKAQAEKARKKADQLRKKAEQAQRAAERARKKAEEANELMIRLNAGENQ